MINYFTYGGVSSRTYGVYISGTNTFNAAQRSIERVTVPGRNGTLTLDNGRFENIELVYPAFIVQNLGTNAAGLRNYLLSSAGYRRLEDTYDTSCYRMARYVNELSFQPTQTLWEANFDIVFDCMPQRFLLTGETETTLSADGSISNPTRFNARPTIRVYGTGTLGVGSETITISTNPEYIDIDCEMMDAYYGSANCNEYITLNSGEFPVLKPGANGVVLGTGITQVKIKPRWWTL